MSPLSSSQGWHLLAVCTGVAHGISSLEPFFGFPVGQDRALCGLTYCVVIRTNLCAPAQTQQVSSQSHIQLLACCSANHCLYMVSALNADAHASELTLYFCIAGLQCTSRCYQQHTPHKPFTFQCQYSILSARSVSDACQLCNPPLPARASSPWPPAPQLLLHFRCRC